MFKDLDRRIKVVLVAQSLCIFVMQFFAQYNILFAQALGASGTDIGLIMLISGLVLLISAPYIGLAIERKPIKRMMILGLICDITAMVIFALANDWRLLIPAFILYNQVIRQIPLADVVFITFTEPHKRATLIGLSRIFCGIMSIFAPLIASAIVTYYGGINMHGIRPLYHISIPILSAALLILYKGLDEISMSNDTRNAVYPKKKSMLLYEYQKFFKSEKYLLHWIVIRLFRDSSHGLLITFAPLWIVNVKGATATMLGILSTLSVTSGLLMQVPAGKLADKFGRKKTFFLFTTFYCVGLIMLILAPAPEYLMLASIFGIGIGGIVGGGIGGAAMTSLLTMWWEAVPSKSIGKLYGLEGIITAVSRILTIAGGILWDCGFGILIMVIPVLVEILVIILLCPVPETLNCKSKSESH
ncbi:MAG: MFS transporter [Candidatus Bathyarchaeia archaeon]